MHTTVSDVDPWQFVRTYASVAFSSSAGMKKHQGRTGEWVQAAIERVAAPAEDLEPEPKPKLATWSLAAIVTIVLVGLAALWIRRRVRAIQ